MENLSDWTGFAEIRTFYVMTLKPPRFRAVCVESRDEKSGEPSEAHHDAMVHRAAGLAGTGERQGYTP